jgi:hypothetical protein
VRQQLYFQLQSARKRTAEFGHSHALKCAVCNNKFYEEKPSMSIEKKSLISTLKTTKKANIAKDDFSVSPATVSAVQKAAAQKSAVQKSAVQKAAVQKSAVQKAAVQKSAVQKSAVQKSAVQKSAVQKSAARKG